MAKRSRKRGLPSTSLHYCAPPITSILSERQRTGENIAEIRRAPACIKELLQVIALAVTLARLALSVWGYNWSTAHKHGWQARGRLRTLNTILGRTPSRAIAIDTTQGAT